jgi:hypothetical protein
MGASLSRTPAAAKASPRTFELSLDCHERTAGSLAGDEVVSPLGVDQVQAKAEG